MLWGGRSSRSKYCEITCESFGPIPLIVWKSRVVECGLRLTAKAASSIAPALVGPIPGIRSRSFTQIPLRDAFWPRAHEPSGFCPRLGASVWSEFRSVRTKRVFKGARSASKIAVDIRWRWDTPVYRSVAAIVSENGVSSLSHYVQL